MRVVDVEGVEWQVTRRWLQVPRWRIGRPRLEDAFGPWDGDLDLGGLALYLALSVVLFVLFLVGLPLLVLVGAVLVAIGELLFRVVFRRPWLVEAKSDVGELRWRVRGTLRSRRAIREIARAFARGDRSFSLVGAERLLPDSPFSSDGQGNVRVIR